MRRQNAFTDNDLTGYYFSLALKADGSLVGWGSNAYQLTNDVPSGTGFVDIAIGRNIAIALRSRWLAWGRTNWSSLFPPI